MRRSSPQSNVKSPHWFLAFFLNEEDIPAFLPLFWLADGYERIAGYPRPRSLYHPAERWRAREEVTALYREMDIYLCASSAEGTPNTLLEAMASGIPVVATRVGVVPALFGSLRQSFIVERSVDAFCQALRRLSTDEDLRGRLAEENLQQIAGHDWSRRAPDWERFFADVIRQSHPHAPYWRRFMISKLFLGASESAARPRRKYPGTE